MNGTEIDEPIRSGIHAIVASAVGLPATPKSDDQLQALIAEHTWFFLAMATVHEQRVVRIEGPSLEVTEPGGDGLAIHEPEPGMYAFTLWEIKKHTGATISRTLNLAYRQLGSRGLRYLNKYALIGEYLDDEALARFYALLPDHWITRSESAAAGVALGTSLPLPTRCFVSFVRHFPEFVDPDRLHGHVAAVTDFPEFSRRVRNKLWSGL